jgi:predicted DNA-binding transcriptional regulator AlpA
MTTNDNTAHLRIVAASNEAPVEIGTELVDEARLALRLDVSRSTLQSWRYSGRGPRYIKIGRLIRYRNADVDAFLAANTHASDT